MSDGRAGLLRDLVLRLLDRADEHDVVPVVQAGSPVLRAVADPYDGWLHDDELARLLDVMRATMHAAPGVGLAGPQVGLPVAIAVLADPGSPDPEVAVVRERPVLPPRTLVNPHYVPLDETRVGFYEGCLSVVGYQAVVARPRRIRLTGQDETGRALDEEVVGWPARIVQHETDHLRGTLYLDRAELRSLSATDATGARWGTPPRPTEAARLLGFPLAGLDVEA
ncbi:peptide deformylase [Cellulomonas endophytica]|uniref:peptide deformylase n=1 Tax=Cellulomonas endophytica TaxID=2494735 RepID=UPI00196B2ABA|nr:peptide deformylase [Cellulomonas endophytica]